MVTAELAVAIPSVVLVLALCLVAAKAAVDQIRCVDAARVASRAAARGDDPARVRALALERRRQVRTCRSTACGGGVRVTVSARTGGWGAAARLGAQRVSRDAGRVGIVTGRASGPQSRERGAASVMVAVARGRGPGAHGRGSGRSRRSCVRQPAGSARRRPRLRWRARRRSRTGPQRRVPARPRSVASANGAAHSCSSDGAVVDLRVMVPAAVARACVAPLVPSAACS